MWRNVPAYSKITVNGKPVDLLISQSREWCRTWFPPRRRAGCSLGWAVWRAAGRGWSPSGTLPVASTHPSYISHCRLLLILSLYWERCWRQYALTTCWHAFALAGASARYLAGALDSLHDAAVDDDPGEQQAQRQIQLHRTRVVDARADTQYLVPANNVRPIINSVCCLSTCRKSCSPRHHRGALFFPWKCWLK